MSTAMRMVWRFPAVLVANLRSTVGGSEKETWCEGSLGGNGRSRDTIISKP